MADESTFAQIAAKDKEEADRLKADERRKIDEARRERDEKKQRSESVRTCPVPVRVPRCSH